VKRRQPRWAIPAALLLLGCAQAFPAVLEQAPFRIQYSEGHEQLAEEALTILEEALAEFSTHLDAGHTPIHVFLCATHREFAVHAGSLAMPSVSGIARSDKGLIAVRTPDPLARPVRFAPTLRHELVHILLARTTDTANLPRWLNEGIAMTLAKEHRWNSSFSVAQQYMRGGLLSYRDLTRTFYDPSRELPFGDVYAQSLSMTRYLRKQITDEQFWRIIRDLKDMRFGQALQKEAGMSPGEFYDAWYRSLWKVALISSLVSGFSLFQAMALLTLVAFMRKRRRGQAVLRAWEEEEAEDLPFMSVLELEQDSEYPWEQDDEEEL
jgi:hypothetical protein